MNIGIAIREQIDINKLPKEALEVLEVFDKLEDHTANLRKKLMSELRPNGNVVHLKLDNVT